MTPAKTTEKWPIMRSTPRHAAITVSGVTGPTPPNQHDPYPHDPTGGWQQPEFYLNQMQPPPPPPKRWSTGLILAITIGSLAVLGLGVGAITALAGGAPSATSATSTPTPIQTTTAPAAAPTTAAAPKGPLVVSLGETLVYTASGLGPDDEIHFTLAAGKQVTRTKYGTRPEKGSFFAVQATIAVKKGSTYACPCDFALVTTDGTAYEGTSFGFDGGLEAIELRAGQQAAGLVVFDLPAGAAAGAKVELRASFATEQQGFWQLP